MKKIFTLSVLALSLSLVFSSCVKDNFNDGNGFNESYWLSKERGEVVYSDNSCSYFVIETYYGYTIVRAYGSYLPYEGSVLYGNFSNRGTRDMYDRSSGYVFSGTITDYWLSYTEAQYALDYYCPFYGKGATREFKKSSFTK